MYAYGQLGQTPLLSRDALLLRKRAQADGDGVWDLDPIDAAAVAAAAAAPKRCVPHHVYATPPRPASWVPQTGLEMKAVDDDAQAKIEAAYQDGLATLNPFAFETLKKYAATCGPSLVNRAARRKLDVLEGRVRMARMEIYQEQRAAEEAAAANQPIVIGGGQPQGGGVGGLIPIAAAAAAALMFT